MTVKNDDCGVAIMPMIALPSGLFCHGDDGGLARMNTSADSSFKHNEVSNLHLDNSVPAY